MIRAEAGAGRSTHRSRLSSRSVMTRARRSSRLNMESRSTSRRQASVVSWPRRSLRVCRDVEFTDIAMCVRGILA